MSRKIWSWDLVREGVGAARQLPTSFLGFCLVPFVVWVVSTIGLFTNVYTYTPAGGTHQALWKLALCIVLGYSWIPVAVAIHRYILLGEQPTGRGFADTIATFLRALLSHRTVRYFLAVLGLNVIFFLGFLPFFLAGLFMPLVGSVPIMATVGMTAVSAYVVGFWLILPARAVDAPFTWRSIREPMRGARFRTFGAALIVFIPVIAVNRALLPAAPGPTLHVGNLAALAAVTTLVTFNCSIVFTAVLSHTYRACVQESGQESH